MVKSHLQRSIRTRALHVAVLGGLAAFTLGSCEIVLDIQIKDLGAFDASIDTAGGSGGTSGSGGTAGSAGTGGSGGTAGSAGTGGSAGSGGTAGTAGTGGTAGADAAGGTGGCAANAPPPGPTGCCGDCTTSPTCGPCASVGAKVCVKSPDRTWAYQIDAHEVTREQFAQFRLAITNGHRPAVPPECSFENSFVSTLTGPNVPNTPVMGVNWCTAHAYCQWAGKRLCGKIGDGGGNGFGDHNDPNLSEWFNACSNGGQKRFPYSDTYDGYKCVGFDWDGVSGFNILTDIPRPVTHAGGCVGGVPGLYDMSGNVWEWDSSCAPGPSPADDYCHVRGGSIGDDATSLICGAGNYVRRGDSSLAIGIRCCENVADCPTSIDASTD